MTVLEEMRLSLVCSIKEDEADIADAQYQLSRKRRFLMTGEELIAKQKEPKP